MIIDSKSKEDAVRVLLVEDDADDVDLTKRALQKQEVALRLEVVEDGEQALAFLHGEPPYQDRLLPDLVLLDLNLPKLNGKEVLARIRKDDTLKSIPVVALTTSDDPRDVDELYRLHVNCFIVKPIGLKEFEKVLESIEAFWFKVVRLPRVVVPKSK